MIAPLAFVFAFVIAHDAHDAHARDGRIEIDDVTHARNLDGTWLFTEGDDAAFARPDFDDHAWRTVTVPGGLGAQGLANVVGAYWYRVHVHVKQAGDAAHIAQLAAAIGEVDSAYELYANGVRVGGRGHVDEPRVDDYVHPGVWPLPSEIASANDIVLALRGFRSASRASANPARGGINHGPVRIGPTDVLARELVTVDVGNFVLIGGFIIAGLYHLELFRRRRSMREYFWFGLFALAVSAYIAAQTNVISDALGVWHDKLTFLAIYLALPCALEFVWIFMRARIRWPWRIWQTAQLLWCVATMAWPDAWLLHRFIRVWELFLLVPLLAGAVFLIGKRAYAGDPEARTLAFGITLLVATALNNIARSLAIADTPELTNVAFAGFVLVMAVSLSNRFTRAYVEIDALLARTLHLSKLKEEFLANTSHELRTPLNAIINLPRAVLAEIEPRDIVVCAACGSTFARDDDTDVDGVACPSCGEASLSIETRRVSPDDADALAQKMESVVHAGEQMLSVVNDIFDASTIASGTLELQRDDVRVAESVRAAIGNVRAKCEQRRVTIVERVDDSVMVSADRARLTQIVTNLVDNAVKFSSEGSAVDVEVARVEGDAVEVRVIDRGPGIAIDQQAIIFEPFRQIDASHTRKHGGTGLGLSIVKELVALHGGTIRVDSVVGRGSTFIVRLPTAR